MNDQQKAALILLYLKSKVSVEVFVRAIGSILKGQT